MASPAIHPEALAAALAGAAKAPPPGYVPDPGAGGGAPLDGGGAPPDGSGGGGGLPPDASAGGPPPDQSGLPPDQSGLPPDASQQGGGTQQAVWSEFPATDPTQVQQLAQQMGQGGDPQALVEMLTGFMQQAQADQDKLSQMHTAMLSHLMDLLQQGGGAPGDTGAPPGGDLTGPSVPGAPPPADQGIPPQGPGVGGVGGGY